MIRFNKQRPSLGVGRVVIPSRNSGNEIWRYLSRIRSTDPDQLDIVYNSSGLKLKPNAAGKPWAGSVSFTGTVITITIGADRSSNKSSYAWEDTLSVKSAANTWRAVGKSSTETVTFDVEKNTLVKGSLPDTNTPNGDMYFDIWYEIVLESGGPTFTNTLKAGGNGSPYQVPGEVIIGRVLLTASGNVIATQDAIENAVIKTVKYHQVITDELIHVDLT